MRYKPNRCIKKYYLTVARREKIVVKVSYLLLIDHGPFLKLTFRSAITTALNSDDKISNDVPRSMDMSRYGITPLNAEIYLMWSNDVEIDLHCIGSWEFVNGSIRPPTSNPELKIHNRKSDIALGTILMTIDSSCKDSVITLRDPVEVWENLKENFHTASEAKIDAKLTKLQQMNMEHGDSIVRYAKKIEAVLNELAAIGHRITDLENKRVLIRGTGIRCF